MKFQVRWERVVRKIQYGGQKGYLDKVITHQRHQEAPPAHALSPQGQQNPNTLKVSARDITVHRHCSLHSISLFSKIPE